MSNKIIILIILAIIVLAIFYYALESVIGTYAAGIIFLVAMFYFWIKDDDGKK